MAKSIMVYDDSAEVLEQAAMDMDTTVADIIESLLDFLNQI